MPKAALSAQLVPKAAAEAGIWTPISGLPEICPHPPPGWHEGPALLPLTGLVVG